MNKIKVQIMTGSNFCREINPLGEKPERTDQKYMVINNYNIKIPIMDSIMLSDQSQYMVDHYNWVNADNNCKTYEIDYGPLRWIAIVGHIYEATITKEGKAIIMMG